MYDRSMAMGWDELNWHGMDGTIEELFSLQNGYLHLGLLDSTLEVPGCISASI